jgi:hypothetical protein
MIQYKESDMLEMKEAGYRIGYMDCVIHIASIIMVVAIIIIISIIVW